MSLPPSEPPQLSGHRFEATYELQCPRADAELHATEIAVEQTVEFPLSHVPDGVIRDQIVGRIEALEPLDADRTRLRMSFAEEVAAGELTQLVNVVYGNVALKQGVRLMDLSLTPGLRAAFSGPRFGVAGLRTRLGVGERPLVTTAVKPMGLSPRAIGELAGQLARGGVDLIKDDHGLTDQPFCPFEERVPRCVEAVRAAADSDGRRAAYVANVTAPGAALLERAHRARELGADGVMVAPGLVGLDGLAALAADASLDLPILAHPSWYGHLAGSRERGIGHRVLYGQLLRLAGADASIFACHGGRFPDTVDDTREVIAGCRAAWSGYPAIFPAPGGGMHLERLPELAELFGPDVMFLIGGGLHTASDDLIANCRAYRDTVEQLLV